MALILDTNALSDWRRLGSSRRREAYQTWLAEHICHFLVLPAGMQTAEEYAGIREELKAAGRPLPTNDVWTAVPAEKHFDAVHGVRRVSWCA